MTKMKSEIEDCSSDQWTTRDLLCLASAVLRYGNKNWESISSAVKLFGDPNRPSEWYTPKKCELQYSVLLTNIYNKKKSFLKEQEAPEELVVKHLVGVRQQELENTVKESRILGIRLQAILQKVESGYFDDHLNEILTEVEGDDKCFEKKYQEWISQQGASPAKKFSILTKCKPTVSKTEECNWQNLVSSEINKQVINESHTCIFNRDSNDVDSVEISPSPQPVFIPNKLLTNVVEGCNLNAVTSVSDLTVSCSAPTLSEYLEIPVSVPGTLQCLPTISYKPNSVSLPIKFVGKFKDESELSTDSSMQDVLNSQVNGSSTLMHNSNFVKGKLKQCEISTFICSDVHSQPKHNADGKTSDVLTNVKEEQSKLCTKAENVITDDEGKQLRIANIVNSDMSNSVVKKNRIKSVEMSYVVIPKRQLKIDDIFTHTKVLTKSVNTTSNCKNESRLPIVVPFQNLSEIESSDKSVEKNSLVQYESSLPEKNCNFLNKCVTLSECDNPCAFSECNDESISINVKENKSKSMEHPCIDTSHLQTQSVDFYQSSKVVDHMSEVKEKSELKQQSPKFPSILCQTSNTAVEGESNNVSDFQQVVPKKQKVIEFNNSRKNNGLKGDNLGRKRSSIVSSSTSPSSSVTYNSETENKSKQAVRKKRKSSFLKSCASSNQASVKNTSFPPMSNNFSNFSNSEIVSDDSIKTRVESIISSLISPSCEKAHSQTNRMGTKITKIKIDSAVDKISEIQKLSISSSSEKKSEFNERSRANNEILDSHINKGITNTLKCNDSSGSLKKRVSGVKRKKKEKAQANVKPVRCTPAYSVSKNDEQNNQAVINPLGNCVEQSISYTELNPAAKKLNTSATTKIKSEGKLMSVSNETKSKTPFRQDESSRWSQSQTFKKVSVNHRELSNESQSNCGDNVNYCHNNEKSQPICSKGEKIKICDNVIEDKSDASTQDCDKGFFCNSQSNDCNEFVIDKKVVQIDMSEKQVSEVCDSSFLKKVSYKDARNSSDLISATPPKSTSLSKSLYVKCNENKKCSSPQVIDSSRNNFVTMDCSDESVVSKDFMGPNIKQPNVKQQDEIWKNSVLVIWKEASRHKYAKVFSQKMTDYVAPQYYSTVHRPLNLSVIKENIDNGTIKTNEEFQRDMMLMFQNVIMCNNSDSNVYDMAIQMQRDVNKRIQDYLATQRVIHDLLNKSSVSSS